MVTVAITVFNKADTVETLLSSLEAQTSQPDLVLEIGGGSRDKTAAGGDRRPDGSVIVKYEAIGSDHEDIVGGSSPDVKQPFGLFKAVIQYRIVGNF